MTAWDDVMVPNYGTPALTLVQGQGWTVTDDAGHDYVDLVAGIAVNVLGHAHPAITAAVNEQVRTLGHTSNLYAHPPGLALAARLHALTGMKCLFTNSGTEANEAAAKLVRKHAADAGRGDGVLVAFERSFHGRTAGALALTGQPAHQAGFSPLPGQIVHVPFNDEAALTAVFDDHDVVGVFAECVQGEGGVIPMQPAVAATLQSLCREHDALLVVDEVQTGIGRTGRMFAYEGLGLDPDVVTLAKGLGGGLPIGACLVRPRFAPVLGPGTHGCTFGGHPVSCVAALAVLETLEGEGLVEAAAAKGEAWGNALGAAGLTVRGQGLLLGIPLDAPVAGDVVARLRRAGYLVGQAGPSVVRLAPPLIVPEQVLLDAVPAIASAIRAALPEEAPLTAG